MEVSDNERSSFHQVRLAAGRKSAQGTVIAKHRGHFMQSHGAAARLLQRRLLAGEDVTAESARMSGS